MNPPGLNPLRSDSFFSRVSITPSFGLNRIPRNNCTVRPISRVLANLFMSPVRQLRINRTGRKGAGPERASERARPRFHQRRATRSPRPERNHQTKRQIRRFYLSINQCAYATPIEGLLHAPASVRQLLRPLDDQSAGS